MSPHVALITIPRRLLAHFCIMSRDGESSVANAEISLFENIDVDMKPGTFVWCEQETMSEVVTSLGGTNSIDEDEEADEDDDEDSDEDEEEADEDSDEDKEADGNKGSTNPSSSVTISFVLVDKFNGRTIPSSSSSPSSLSSLLLFNVDMSSGATKSSFSFVPFFEDEKRGPTNELACSCLGSG